MQENLIPMNERSKDEVKKIAAKGGVNSGVARRKKKQLRECLELLLEKKYTSQDGKKVSGAELLAAKAMQGALAGDWKAWELVRDTAGQKPVDKVVTSEVDIEVLSEIDAYINAKQEKGT